jgi:hypothetical protein
METAMKPTLVLSAVLAMAGSGTAAQDFDAAVRAEAFKPAHADLPRSGGMPAQLADEAYVEALARLVYYWGYPAIDVTSRTSMWEIMEVGPGLMFGIGPGAPRNASACLAGYLPANERIIVTPNNDTFYGVSFVDLGTEPVVVQTPEEVPEGHYWVMQIVDVFTNVVRTLGSASGTEPGKYLLAGRTGRARRPRASSRRSGFPPTTERCSRAALRRAPPRRADARSPCRTGCGSIR